MRDPSVAVQPTQSNDPINELPVSVDAKQVSRREFLYYLWGASAALLGAEAVGAGIWFSFPHIRYGRESGVFLIDFALLPTTSTSPNRFADGKFWIAMSDSGLRIFSAACPYRGVSVKWVSRRNQFECPHCGRKFRIDGRKIQGEGPASRNLDQFPIEVRIPWGTRRTPPDGSPVDIRQATAIIVDTRFKILGKQEVG
jgi:cytochrome b6-f complex iron-sulfur subunit